jgi:hypothetical protein
MKMIGEKPLTHISTLVMYFQFPDAMWSFAPLMNGHERPIVEAGSRHIVDSISIRTRQEEKNRLVLNPL